MLEHRKVKFDLVALGLLALAVFLAASLFSYHPADPPTHLVAPPHDQIVNLCGRSGALASSLLFNALGLGAYYLWASLCILDALLLTRHQIAAPWLRGIGWLISLAGLCTLAALALPGLSPGPIIGAGGFLGAAGRGLLEMNFAATGAYIIVASLIAGGLLLSTDYVLVKLLAWTVGVPARNLGRSAVRVGMAYAHQVRRRRSDLEPVEPSEAPPAPSRVRVAAPPKAEKPQSAPAVAPETPEPSAAEKGDKPKPPESLKVAKPKKDQRRQLIEEIAESAAEEAADADYELPSLDLLLAERAVPLRRAREGGPPQGQDPGKDLRRLRLQRPRRRDPDRARSSPSSKSSSRPACGSAKITGPGRRPGDRPARAQRAHRRPDSRQEHRRHRSAQRPSGSWSASAR